jgi:uncharacterized membrane protein required for colicin V production
VLFVAGMARSGFKRGFVFYAIDLVGFVASVVAAVRFHEIPAVAYDIFGMSPHAANAAGGLTIFVPLIALTAIVGSKLARAMYKPGLFTANRVLGAAFAAVLGAVVVLVGVLFIRTVAPSGLRRLVNDSLLAPRIVDAAAPLTAAVDDRLGLDLCGGRLARAAPEICAEDARIIG